MGTNCVGQLEVEGGAHLHYEISGAGPMVLLIHGSGGDVETYRNLIGALTKRYTVVAYDRRNCGQSTPKNASLTMSITEHADDAERLLAALNAQSVNIFASSAGATIGLDLITRHPGRVGILVVHEPPIVNLLPDASALHSQFSDVLATAQSGDLLQATTKFLTLTGILGDDSGGSLRVVARALAARPSLFCEIEPITSFVPDITSLLNSKRRLVIGSGEENAESMPCRASLTLAALLAVPLLRFPGNHLGYIEYANRFAALLDKIFNPVDT